MDSITTLQLHSNMECSICTDIFTDPVSTSCGHSFCKVCIDTYWDDCDVFMCPLCKVTFKRRPPLQVNIILRDITEQIKRTTGKKQEQKKSSNKPLTVVCDECSGDQSPEAKRSCVDCEVNVCTKHLRFHEEHTLLEPVKRLKDRVCKEHGKPLDLICRSDLTTMCIACSDSNHKGHKFIILEKRLKRKKLKAEMTLEEMREMIKERWQMVKKTEQCVLLSKRNAQTDMEDTARVFPALIKNIEEIQEALINTIKLQSLATEKRCNTVIEDLKKEIDELEKQGDELKTLVQDNCYNMLQCLPSQCALPPTKDWSEVSAYSDPGVGLVRSAVLKVLPLLASQAKSEGQTLIENEIKRIQQYAVNVTLDPNTANPLLVLSEDCKAVSIGATEQNVPDNPERFDTLLCVLGKEGYSSGAFYYEVQVKDKCSWDIGVALATVDRKGLSGIDLSNGYCVIMLRDGDTYLACDRPHVTLSLPKNPQRIGVFVDFDVGEVCFYDVENNSHIYSYTGKQFPNKLHPYFNPCSSHKGKNAAPLVISSLNQEQSLSTAF